MVIGSIEFKRRADAPAVPGSGKQKFYFNENGKLVSLSPGGGSDTFLMSSDLVTIAPHDHDDRYYRKSTNLALTIALG